MKHFDSIEIDRQVGLGVTSCESHDVSSLAAAYCPVDVRSNAGTRVNNPTSYGDVRRASSLAHAGLGGDHHQRRAHMSATRGTCFYHAQVGLSVRWRTPLDKSPPGDFNARYILAADERGGNA